MERGCHRTAGGRLYERTAQSHAPLTTVQHAEQTLLDPCKHHQAKASEAEAVLGMDVKTESQPKTRRLTIRSTPHRIASTTYTHVRLHLGSTLSEMQRACERCCTMAAVSGRKQASIQTRFSGSLLRVEKHRGQTGSNRL
jgi:NMD protein affecting ribosome stability and mRNA decay